MLKITGKVVHGQHVGKKLGYPTANLDRRQYVRQRMKLGLGVYAGWAQIFNLKSLILNPKRYKAAIVIGPLDRHRLPKIEAHLLGFTGKLYGKKITISLKKFLRPFKKYQSEEALKKQIKLDIVKVKELNI